MLTATTLQWHQGVETANGKQVHWHTCPLCKDLVQIASIIHDELVALLQWFQMRNNLPAKQSASCTLSFAHCLNALIPAASQKACK